MKTKNEVTLIENMRKKWKINRINNVFCYFKGQDTQFTRHIQHTIFTIEMDKTINLNLYTYIYYITLQRHGFIHKLRVKDSLLENRKSEIGSSQQPYEA